MLGGYVLSPSVVQVPGTDWTEPVLVWLSIAMPTGSGKSTLFRHIYNVLRGVRSKCIISEDDPSWVFDDASFEKMGALMHANSSRLLGLYDEMSAFLSQINLYRGQVFRTPTNWHYFYNFIMAIHGGVTQVSELIGELGNCSIQETL